MRKRISLVLLLIIIADSLYAAGTGISVSGTSMVLQFLGSIFDNLYMLFTNQLNLSFSSLRDNMIPQLCFVLILCEVSWLALQAILQKSMSLPEVIMKFFLVILVIIVTQNLNWIVSGLMKIFTSFAKTAGDPANLYAGDVALFLPSTVITSTSQMIHPLSEARDSISAFMDGIDFGIFKDNISIFLSLYIPAFFAKGVLWIVEIILLIMICFCNINVTMWLIEFQFLMVVCMICLPWHIFSPPKFLSSGVWQALFGQAIKLFVIVFLVSIAPNLFQTITADAIGNLLSAFFSSSAGVSFAAVGGLAVTSIAVCITYCYFLLKGPAIAKAIIVGQPTMETLGSHFVTRLGAGALGTVGTGMVAAGSGITGALGALLGIIFGNRRQPGSGDSSASGKSGNGSNVNNAKLDAGD